MPAIAPPESPDFDEDAGALDVALGDDVAVAEVNNGGRDVVAGNFTPGHRLSTFEELQQESVALTELAAQ